MCGVEFAAYLAALVDYEGVHASRSDSLEATTTARPISAQLAVFNLLLEPEQSADDHGQGASISRAAMRIR
jgi:hypothetical protein